MNPRSDCWWRNLERMPPGMELKLTSMIVIGRPHRSNDRKIVHAFAHMGEPVAHFDSALPAFSVAHLHREQARLTQRLYAAGNGLSDVVGNRKWVVERVLKRRLWSCFPLILVQRRFGIERIYVAHAAYHEEPDNTFRLGSEMRLAVRWSPLFRCGGSNDAIALQHGAECKPGEAHAKIRQNCPPRWVAAGTHVLRRI